jgi:hypothetical protein
MSQFTATPGCGFPLESVTFTTIGEKPIHVWQIICPFPDTMEMFCADAVWAEKSPASTAANTITLSLFKTTSSFDARTRLDWDGRGENCSVPLPARMREWRKKKEGSLRSPLSRHQVNG